MTSAKSRSLQKFWNKPGRFESHEMEIMKQHVLRGGREGRSAPLRLDWGRFLPTPCTLSIATNGVDGTGISAPDESEVFHELFRET